jgi:DNA-binding XRE family transcriptional regulator
MDREIVAQRLRKSRKKSGLNQHQAAEKLGTSQSAVVSYETGKRLPPIDILVAMSELYSVSCEYLLGTKNVRLGAWTTLGKSIVELLLSGKVQRIETADENLNKVVKNIMTICNLTQLTRSCKIELLEAYIQNLRE